MSTDRDASETPKAARLSPSWACPRCGGDMGDDFRCPACRLEYPTVGGVPWLFAEPQAALVEWRSRADYALRLLERDAAAAEAALTAGLVSPSTRRRLEALRDGYRAQHATMAALLSPLGVPTFARPIETHLALRTRLPASQGVSTYYHNIFRDWCWGEAENAASVALVAPTLRPTMGVRLVLGAGAGRLAYDLHLQHTPGATLALDFNPLLVLVGERVVRGDRVALHEMPMAPRTIADTARLRELGAGAPLDASFRFVLADALRVPLRAGSVDEIVTPWFVDVVEEDLATLAARINALLAPGGRWSIFGSLAFANADPRRCYGREEVDEVLAGAGFVVDGAEDAEIPYMSAPGSRHGRRERVVAIAATKVRGAQAPPRHVALPDWIVRSDRPVPLLPTFRTQAFTTRIYAFVMSLIDGRRTLRDMAQLMEQQKLMPADEAEAAIRTFLTKMYDESRQPTR
jgi:hypothetical protein